MQTTLSSHQAFAAARRQTWIARGAGVAVLFGVAVIFWLAATYHTTVIKKEAPVSMLMPVQAPPPPPPPKEIKPQETETAPLDQPITPQQQASPDNAITQNAEAQIGGDAFGIGSGSGEGMRGGGVAGMLNRGPYAAYMAQVIRSAVNRNDMLRGKSFKVAISLWLSPIGKVERVALRSSTGSDEFDRELKSVLATISFDHSPPQSVLDTQPVNMTIDIRQSF